MQRYRFVFLVAALALAVSPSLVQAVPYASNVVKTGTTVNFILNEPSDTLKYSINGGALQSLDGTTKGAKTFNLGAANDTFSIVAEKNAAVGWSIPTGVILPAASSALARRMLIALQKLPFLRGVKRMECDSSSMLCSTPSIQP